MQEQNKKFKMVFDKRFYSKKGQQYLDKIKKDALNIMDDKGIIMAEFDRRQGLAYWKELVKIESMKNYNKHIDYNYSKWDYDLGRFTYEGEKQFNLKIVKYFLSRTSLNFLTIKFLIHEGYTTLKGMIKDTLEYDLYKLEGKIYTGEEILLGLQISEMKFSDILSDLSYNAYKKEQIIKEIFEKIDNYNIDIDLKQSKYYSKIFCYLIAVVVNSSDDFEKLIKKFNAKVTYIPPKLVNVELIRKYNIELNNDYIKSLVETLSDTKLIKIFKVYNKEFINYFLTSFYYFFHTDLSTSHKTRVEKVINSIDIPDSELFKIYNTIIDFNLNIKDTEKRIIKLAQKDDRWLRIVLRKFLKEEHLNLFSKEKLIKIAELIIREQRIINLFPSIIKRLDKKDLKFIENIDITNFEGMYIEYVMEYIITPLKKKGVDLKHLIIENCNFMDIFCFDINDEKDIIFQLINKYRIVRKFLYLIGLEKKEVKKLLTGIFKRERVKRDYKYLYKNTDDKILKYLIACQEHIIDGMFYHNLVSEEFFKQANFDNNLNNIIKVTDKNIKTKYDFWENDVSLAEVLYDWYKYKLYSDNKLISECNTYVIKNSDFFGFECDFKLKDINILKMEITNKETNIKSKQNVIILTDNHTILIQNGLIYRIAKKGTIMENALNNKIKDKEDLTFMLEM